MIKWIELGLHYRSEDGRLEIRRFSDRKLGYYHNHPSGDPKPSKEDVELTERLKAASSILNVTLLDHIVMGHDTFFSFNDQGVLR